MYQPADGDDVWDVIIERHNSVKGRGHLARPGAWLDPGYLTIDIGVNFYDGSQLSLDQNQVRVLSSCGCFAFTVRNISVAKQPG